MESDVQNTSPERRAARELASASATAFDSKVVIPETYRRWERNLAGWADLLFKAGVWALLLWQFVFQVSEVKGDSMRDSFHDADRLIIDKVTYKLRPIRRGDVIVFSGPRKQGGRDTGQRVDFIKRVIGLPGDTVIAEWMPTDTPGVYRHRVFVNGREVPEPTMARTRSDDARRVWGQFDYGRPFRFERRHAGSPSDVIPAGRCLVMGDNRLFSRDSRDPEEMGDEDGLIPFRDVIGYVRLRFSPWTVY